MQNWPRLNSFLLKIKGFVIVLSTAVLSFVMLVFVARSGIVGQFLEPNPVITQKAKARDLPLPTIINGELVLPTDKNNLEAANSTLPKEGMIYLGVISANVLGIPSKDSSKLDGLRIFGEIKNNSQVAVSSLDAVVRFIGEEDKRLGQKVGKLSEGYIFPGMSAGEKTLYDITVDEPIESAKIEIVISAVPGITESGYKALKIGERNFETKFTQENQNASESGDQVEYYMLSGKVVNVLDTHVTDIYLRGWARDGEGKVFALGRQQFKNDLLPSGESLPFRFMVLPARLGDKYETYEVEAWGKEFKLPK